MCLAFILHRVYFRANSTWSVLQGAWVPRKTGMDNVEIYLMRVKTSQYLNTSMQMCIGGLGLNILKLEESKTISGKKITSSCQLFYNLVALIWQTAGRTEFYIHRQQYY